MTNEDATRLLQSKLNSLGWEPPLLVDGEYGPKTKAAEKALLHDTPATDDVPIPRSFRRWVLEVARSQVGERELRHNSGPMIDQYLASVWLKPGEPYCMAGLVWCGDKAAVKLGTKNPMPKVGGTQYFLELCRNKGWEIAKNKAEPCDIGIMRFTSNRGHAYIIEEVRPHGSLATIEFNSNDKGSRDGEGVVNGRRDLSDPQLAGIIRLPEPDKA